MSIERVIPASVKLMSHCVAVSDEKSLLASAEPLIVAEPHGSSPPPPPSLEQVEPIDTGKSLYAKLEAALVTLFCDTWPALEAGTAGRAPQGPGGTVHRARDLAALDRIDLDAPTTARALIDTLRARTFPPYDGAFFEVGGRRVYLDLSLRYRDEGGKDA